jgi:hypothetical protein
MESQLEKAILVEATQEQVWRAWTFVLANLAHSFAKGSIDWNSS